MQAWEKYTPQMLSILRIVACLIFIAHGTRGGVLPIDVSSGRRVARLERDGYEVRYRKFDGGHAVPRDRARGSGLVRRLARLRG